MDRSLEITNIKKEWTDSTSSDRLEIPSELQVENNKQKRDCLVQSRIYIKAKPQEDDSEFPVFATSSHDMYPNNDIKFETVEPLIKIESKDLFDELVQDPLEVGSEIKDKEHFPTDLNTGGSRIKIEPMKVEKDENVLEIDKTYVHESGFIDSDQSIDKKYVCNVCNTRFIRKWHLNNHLRIHTRAKPFDCDICKKSFSQKGNLDTHMLIHSGEKTHICDMCKKGFTQKASLNLHKLIHSGVKPFSCNECGKSFARHQDFEKHKRVHTGDKPYACESCGKTFAQITNLIQHRHLHTGLKPYSCDICNKSFAQKAGLHCHKLTHKN